MIYPIVLLAELLGGVEAFLEIGLHCRRSLVLFVLRKTPRLAGLKGRHSPMELLVRAYKFGLRIHISVYVFGVNLYWMRSTLGIFWLFRRVFLKWHSVSLRHL